MKWADATNFVLAKARVRPRLGVLPSPTPHLRACFVSTVAVAGPEPSDGNSEALTGVPGPRSQSQGTRDCPCFPHSCLPLSFLHLLFLLPSAGIRGSTRQRERERMYGIPWREVKITFKNSHTQAYTLLTKHCPQFEVSFASQAAG